MFENVVVLDMIMCQAGENPEAIAFRALLMRMRDGEITEADWNLLLECSTKNVLMDEFNDAIRLFFDKKSVAEYNYDRLLQNGQPVAKIHAKHRGHTASTATSDETGGLEAVLFISNKAEVILTCNIWAKWVSAMGSLG